VTIGKPGHLLLPTSSEMSPSIDQNDPSVLSKRQWRRLILAAISALEPGERRAQERSLIGAFPALPGFATAETVLLYVSAFPEELETREILACAFDMGKRVLCPRVDRVGRQLRLHMLSHPETELKPGVLGIPEPQADLPEVPPELVDWVLAPGLGFDERGYRLGRGAGHYDRLLARLRPDAVCWALSLGCQLVPQLPVEPHDMPLDGITAPDRVIRGPRHGLDHSARTERAGGRA
jgi:5-formyltetrahydrofolate cyclo-ligase